MKIIEYELVEVEDVNKFINKGWQPFGSPIGNFNQNYQWQANAYQAMVKYEEDPKDTLQLNPSTLNHWVSSAGDNINRRT